MGGLGGEVGPTGLGSLWAGGDKGETGWHLPLCLVGRQACEVAVFDITDLKIKTFEIKKYHRQF